MEHAVAKTTAGNEHLVKVIYPKYTVKREEKIGWFLHFHQKKLER